VIVEREIYEMGEIHEEGGAGRDGLDPYRIYGIYRTYETNRFLIQVGIGWDSQEFGKLFIVWRSLSCHDP
jgi:hypothetical protein